MSIFIDFSARLLGISAGVLAITLSSPAATSADTWRLPHADGANSGFADVATQPAAAPAAVIQNIGTFAPGAGPVVAPDGTVFIGNEQGKLMSFHPDGTPGWSRDIPGQSIVASPAIGADGSIYVIGLKTFTDHRVSPAEVRQTAVLHKFTAGGGWVRQTNFPAKWGAGATTAAPNIWQSGGTEVIVVPIAYQAPLHGPYNTHLLAFTSDAQLIADADIGFNDVKITSGTGWDVTWSDLKLLECLNPPFIQCISVPGFRAEASPVAPLPHPLPTAAIYDNGGAAPLIVVADGFQNLVVYALNNGQLSEAFRVHDDSDLHSMWATPTIMQDRHTVLGSTVGLRFAGPNTTPIKSIGTLQTFAASTLLPDGRVITVSTYGEVNVLFGGVLKGVTRLNAGTIASAAASRNHIFVSTDTSLVTFDANTMRQVAIADWAGGGLSSPVIGPQGQVYAIAGNNLYVFGSAPAMAGGAGTAKPGNGGIVADPANPAGFPTMNQHPVVNADPTMTQDPAAPSSSSSSSKAFRPPLTASGNRLFACLALDGEDCGKGDARTIAQAFCSKQGFSGVDDIRTDNKKTTAETLDGQLCTRKKCKVFDKIVCTM